MQLDWTHAKELKIRIAGHPLDHLLCQAVLPYSNWQWATRCQSESLLSLRAGLQAALFRLGKVPKRLQIDNSSAATHQISGAGKREFNPEFLSLAEHYGLGVRTIHVGCPNENGDVEAHNGHLKRRLEQHLLLRGYARQPSISASAINHSFSCLKPCLKNRLHIASGEKKKPRAKMPSPKTRINRP